MKVYIDCNYITEDTILNGIYERSVRKFMDKTDNIIIYELIEYITKQLNWKKQDHYHHSLPLLKAVCYKIAENFEGFCDYICPEAETPRDLYFAIYD